MYKKKDDAYKTIGEVAKELNLRNLKTGKLQTYILRFWENQFNEMGPSVKIGRRRFYSPKDIQTIKIIKSLLKEEGFTIKGVKKLLSSNKIKKLDETKSLSVEKYKNKHLNIKERVKKISKLVKELKEF